MSAPFMQFYTGDYLRDTQHLTTEQHGAYLLLLMAMWHRCGWLPNDPGTLARLSRLTKSRWLKISPSILAFMHAEGDLLTQKRLLSEFEKASEKSEKRRRAGAIGNDVKSLKSNNSPVANGNALRPHSPEPDSERRKKKKEDSPSLALGDGFEDWYKIYPRHIDPKDARRAYDKALAKVGHGKLLEAAKSFAEKVRFKESKFIPHPATWLNKERWLEESAPEQAVSQAHAFAERVRLFAEKHGGSNVRRLVKNFELTFGTEFERAADRLAEFEGRNEGYYNLNEWFWQFGHPDCSVGPISQ